MKTSKKVRAELFVLSDKELIETICKRVKEGSLDAQFIVSSEILEEFPYCRKAYNTLIANGVPVRLFAYDEKINQRLHCKWAVFDDKEVLIGSTNWSAVGLNQNLKIGAREDYELYAVKIDEEIKDYFTTAKYLEKKLGIPSIRRDKKCYESIIQRRKTFKRVINELNILGATSVMIDGKQYNFTDEQKSDIQTTQGYYGIIKDRYNAKEKYKRGNNELAIAFTKPILANVFNKQFKKDWKYSVSEYEKFKDKFLPISGSEMQKLNMVG